MSVCDAWEDYVKDSRTVCKYGTKCYQENPEHHTKYKHPPHYLKNKLGHRNKHRFSPYKRDSTTPRHDKVTKDEELTTKTSSKEDNLEDAGTSSNTANNTCSTAITSDTFNVKTPLIIKESPEDVTYHDSKQHTLYRELFLVDMPQDFFKFYECLNEDNNIEKTLSSVNLELIGPYDLLQGKLPDVDDKELYLVHWRFFYDPPEFQSVLKKKGKSEYHIGYFRDDPNETPAFVGSNNAAIDYNIKPLAYNIFAAVYMYLQNEKKSSPFTAVTCQKLMERVKKYAEENKFTLDEFNMKKRQAAMVTKSFHGAGIVVPYNKKTQLGYRHLVENDATIKKLFAKLEAAKTQSEKDSILSDLQPVITYASIAVDECDFGTGIEVGIALFCSGLKELEPSALSSLIAAYLLVNRESFGKIVQAHIKFRRKGPNMSMLSISNK